MITVIEYVTWKQPEVAVTLLIKLGTMILRDIKEQHPFRWWARLMEERPLPGRAGLLPGEVNL
ncbi:MAG: hypothetical protein IMW94_10470 [Thermoanaerobacter sp.]|nr:hypothetical protein [Thermoanaerobacter sp.]